MMRNMTGPPVTGDDFFGREKEIKLITNNIVTGQSVLLAAPRRVGKTSLAKNLKPEGYICCYVNLEGETDEHAALEKIASEVKDSANGYWEKGKKLINNISFTAELFWFKGNVSFGSMQSGLKKILENKQGKLLICLDELPLFLMALEEKENGKARAVSFLSKLRSLRTEVPDCVWLLLGSVGLEEYVADLGESARINDLNPVKLGAYDVETANNFLKKLGKSNERELSAEERKIIIEALNWPLPYFLQLFFKIIVRDYSAKEIDDHSATEIIKTIMQESGNSLRSWVERLHKLSEPLQSTAIAILDDLAKQTKGYKADLHQIKNRLEQKSHFDEAQSKAFSRAVKMLVHDGYILTSANEAEFRSPILKYFWKNELDGRL